MSFVNYVSRSRILKPVFESLANWYPNVAGYRRYGLRYDDLLLEETPVMQEAIRRLTEKEANGRVHRIRQAFQLSLTHSELPKDKWTTAEQDIRYLSPIVRQVEAEFKEREHFDTLKSR